MTKTTTTTINADDKRLQGLLDYIVAAANYHTGVTDGMTDDACGEYLRELILANDVVFALWEDKARPEGLGIVIVHDGVGLFRGKADRDVSISAIACSSEQDALELVAIVERFVGGATIN